MKPFLRNSQLQNPADPALATAYAQALASLPLELSLLRLRALAELGSLARLQENYALSEAHFQMALTESEQLHLPALGVANRIRLGLTYHYANDYVLAEACFRQALAESRASSAALPYQDFALQHLGKLCVEQNRWDEAGSYFEKALKLREAKGDEELISSTRQALQSLADLRSAN